MINMINYILLESRIIEKSGGYVFANANVPTSFNFGGNMPSS